MNATATLVLRSDERADDYGSIEIDQTGRISRFLDSKASHAPMGALRKLMFTGVQILEPRIFAYMEGGETKKFSTTKHTYPRMLIGGERLFGFYFDGFWQDLGTPARIREAELRLKAGRERLHFL
jgi:NDP-sugar pyrophosphorylase family protein